MFETRFGTAFPASFGGVGTLAREMDRLFSGLPTMAPVWQAEAPAPRAFPALNVWEDADRIVVEAELPGYTLKDIQITMLGDELTISGGRAAAEPAEGVRIHRQERPASRTTRFTRTVSLATPVDRENVSATLDNGILTVWLPKAQAAKPRTIAVNARNN